MTVDDVKVHDDRLRILLRDARAKQVIQLANMETHPVRKYYQLRAMLSGEYHQYRASRRAFFELKAPTTPRLTTVF